MACLLSSKSSRKIAAVLNIQPKSVDTHIYNMTHKLGVHSRSDLISFIEQSENLVQLRAHYTTLLRVHHFKEAVQKTSSYMRGQSIKCRIKCTNSKLLKKITCNLKKVGIGVVGAGKTGQANNENIKSIQIVLPSATTTKTSGFLEPFSVYYVGNDEVLFFEIVHHLCPSAWTEEALAYFVVESQKNGNEYKHHNQPVSQSSRFRWIFTVCVISLCLLFLFSFLYMQKVSVSESVVIHSVFSIPDDSQRLNRRQLLSEIEQRFDKKQNIQTVVLVGIGGSGKTMLARQYAKNQRCPIVWEINAETKDTAVESFFHLAWVLAATSEEKVELERIKNGKDQQFYYKQLIHFVREKLVQRSCWFLLLDNVSKLADIQDFLPIDTKAWGKGAVLITTRNSTIAESTLIKKSNVITVKELSADEKLALFVKIKEVPLVQHKKLNQFLRFIPSFPLDISIAAYYLKNTNSSYADYLKQLQIEHSKMKSTILTFTAGLGHYTENRQDIVACTVERMLPQHKDFPLLLLLVSTVGNRTIPKELFKRQSRTEVVDLFVQQMCQSSLMTYDQQGASVPTLSLHESTQEAVFRYLMSIFTGEEQFRYLDMVADLLFDYVEDVVDDLDYSMLPTLIPHVQRFAMHLPEKTFRRIKMDFQLGHIYYHLGDHAKAKKLFETVICGLKMYPTLNKEQRALLLQTLVHASSVDVHVGRFKEAKILLEEGLKIYQGTVEPDQLSLASALMYYGRLSREMGEYTIAMKALKKSNAIYSKYYGDDHPKTAWAQFRLGEVYSSLGDTKQAKHYYEKSLKTYQKKYGQQHRRTLWILFRLGTVYRIEGQYQKARVLLEKVYNIYKDRYKEDQDGYALMAPHLGDIYRRLGLYEQARPLLESAQNFYKKQYAAQQNIYTEWCAFFLGRFYTDSGDYAKACQLLEQSLAVHTEQLGENHIKTMLIKRTLAHAYVGLGQFDRAQALYQICQQKFALYFGKKHVEYGCLLYRFGYLQLMRKDFVTAKAMLTNALSILRAGKHTETYRCLEYLGDLHKEQGDTKQANTAYHTAFLMAYDQFPKNSIHIARLKIKVSFLQRGLLFVKCLYAQGLSSW